MTALRISAATNVAMCRLRELSCDIVSVCLLIAVHFSTANDVVKLPREAGFDVLFVCRTIVWSPERRQTCTSL